MDLYKISAADAKERIALQDQVSALVLTLGQTNSDSFGGIWIQHEPVYKIMIGFKDASTRQAIRETIEPRLRRHVQIMNVRYSVTERDALTDQIIAALAPTGLRYVSYYDHKNDKLVIEVGADSGVGKVRQLLPKDMLDFVQVKRGVIPESTQASGVVAGDGIYPGRWYSASQGTPYACSFSFAAKDNQGREGILTAAHCPATPWIYFSNPSAHWVSLAAPRFSWNSTKYVIAITLHRAS